MRLNPSALGGAVAVPALLGSGSGIREDRPGDSPVGAPAKRAVSTSGSRSGGPVSKTGRRGAVPRTGAMSDQKPYTLPEAAAAVNQAGWEFVAAVATAFRAPLAAEEARRRALASESARWAYREEAERAMRGEA